jgi:hypothetical protein
MKRVHNQFLKEIQTRKLWLKRLSTSRRFGLAAIPFGSTALTVSPGRLDDFNQHVAEAVAKTESGPTRSYISIASVPTRKSADIVERHVDSAAVVVRVSPSIR